MKKIINGKIYNTENAIEIGNDYASCGQSDFRYWNETLYQTPRSKTFFLAGEGGAMSQWGKSCGGGSARCWGDGIKPLSKDQALEWAERHLDTPTIEKYFSNMIEEA
jgi:hypothetical protein